MSFLSGSTREIRPPEQRQFGLEEQRLPTNEQARPVPWLVGKRRIGVTWISNLFNALAEPVRQEVGKKSDPITTGYNYFADVACLICHGPVDSVHAVYMDDELVWSGTLSRPADGTNSTTITITGRGTCTLYWGTETQSIDPLLATLTAASVVAPNEAEEHPAYRGQCYAVFEQLFFGYQKTQPPTIEFVLARYPSVSWMTDDSAVDEDANLVAAVADALQNHRAGLGLPDSRIDTSTLDAVADLLRSEGLGLSPLVNNAGKFRQALIELLEYFDVYHYTDTQGRLVLGLVREPTGICGDTAYDLDESDLVDVPVLNPDSWGETKDKVYVRWTNRDNGFKEDAVKGDDRGNFAITAEPASETLQRPAITKFETAVALADVAAKTFGLPDVSGELRIKKSSLGDLVPGSAVKLLYGHWSICYLYLRIEDIIIESPVQPQVTLQVRRDRAYLAAATVTPDAYTPPTPPTYAPVAFSNEVIKELPYGIFELRDPLLAAIVDRPTTMTTRAVVHAKRADASFVQVRDIFNFAVRGHLLAGYSADTNVIDRDTGMLIEIDSEDSTMPDIDWQSALTNEYLLWVNDEIMSVFGATLVAAGQYRLYGIRGRFDTRRAAHSTSDVVRILRRSAHEPWRRTGSEGDEVYKLQPSVLGQTLSLASASEVTASLDQRALRPLAPLNLMSGGRRDPVYRTGEDVTLGWDTTSEQLPGFWSIWDGGWSTDLPSTVIRILTTGDVLKQEIEVVAGTETYTATNANLTSWLGSEVSFKARAYHKRNGLLSTIYEQITVTKV